MNDKKTETRFKNVRYKDKINVTALYDVCETEMSLVNENSGMKTAINIERIEKNL